jgi:hypothetical protein
MEKILKLGKLAISHYTRMHSKWIKDLFFLVLSLGSKILM